MKPTVITLGNDPSKSAEVQIATFEEAFGEHSEARGRGRARRQARRLDRKKKRQERRMTKLRNRQERKRLRHEMHDEKLQSRLARKAARKASRHHDDVDDSAEQDSVAPDSGASDNASMQNDESTQSQAQDSGAYQDESTDSGSDEGNSNEVESPSEDSQDSSDEGSDEGSDESESGFDGNYNDGAESSYNSDLKGAEDMYSSFASEPGAEGKPIDARIRKITAKIAYGERLLKSLQARYRKEPENRRAISKRAHEVQRKLKSLRASLLVYGKNPEKAREIGAGHHFASKAIDMHIKKHKANSGKSLAAHEMKMEKPVVTKVEKSLHAEIKPNKITVPAKKSSADGTGVIGIDDAQDFDANRSRVVELTSSADGMSTHKDRTKAILIGIALAAATVYFVKKYKPFGK